MHRYITRPTRCTGHLLGLLFAVAGAAGCERQAPARSIEEPTADGGDAEGLLDARPVDARAPDPVADAQMADAAPAPAVCGPEHPFDRALAQAWLDPQNVACTDGRDCVEVELCPGEFCVVGDALNRAAGAAIDEAAPPEARCADCGPDEPLNCPEPEPPMEDCAEGFCQMGFGGPVPIPPEDCVQARASWGRALDAALTNRDAWCDVDADCTAVSLGNGCTDGACVIRAVRRDREAAVRARIAAHLDFNDCGLCGDAPAPCGFDGSVRCETFCQLVE